MLGLPPKYFMASERGGTAYYSFLSPTTTVRKSVANLYELYC